MVVLTANGLERFTPEHYEGAAGAPVFLLAKPTFRTKSQVIAELARGSLRFVSDQEILTAIKEAIAEHKPDNLDDLMLVISQWEEEVASGPLPDQPTQDDGEAEADFQARVASWEERRDSRQKMMDAYNEIGDVVRRFSIKVADLIADRTRYQTMIIPILVSVYLRGWENVSARFRRLGDTVSEDIIEAITPEDLNAIAGKISGMATVSKAQRGN